MEHEKGGMDLTGTDSSVERKFPVISVIGSESCHIC